MKRLNPKTFHLDKDIPQAEFQLDKIDKQILKELQKNNQLTNLELAQRVNISPPPCLRRVKRLRDEGVIIGDVSIVDPYKIKQNLIVFISVTLEKQSEELMLHFERKMLEHTQVKQCYFISGEVDYLLMVHVSDINEYNEFIRKVFVNSENIKYFRSNFCLTRIKYDTAIDLD